MPNTTEVKRLKYIPALDGVRGIFCLLIITHHWIMPYLQGPFALLWWILQLFFVLSAYLITKVLLYDKSRMGTKDLLKRFYVRRSLRIFPLYYLYTLLIGGLLLLAGTTEMGATNKDVIYFKENWFFLYTYTYNFAEIINYFRGIEIENIIPAPLFSHLWSLSLEEQFYFVIPLIIAVSPMKYLRIGVLSLIIAAPVIRLVAYSVLQSIHPDENWLGLIAFRNTIFQMDSLAYGVAIAIFDVSKIKRAVLWFLLIASVWLSYTLISGYYIAQSGAAVNLWHAIKEYTFMTHHYNYTLLFTIANMMCAFFVITLVNDTAMAKLFSSKLTVFLGKLSYSMYVWHYFVMLIAAGILHMFFGDLEKFFGNFIVEVGMFSFYVGLLILVSYLSYRYFEVFFVKLKTKF